MQPALHSHQLRLLKKIQWTSSLGYSSRYSRLMTTPWAAGYDPSTGNCKAQTYSVPGETGHLAPASRKLQAFSYPAGIDSGNGIPVTENNPLHLLGSCSSQTRVKFTEECGSQFNHKRAERLLWDDGGTASEDLSSAKGATSGGAVVGLKPQRHLRSTGTGSDVHSNGRGGGDNSKDENNFRKHCRSENWNKQLKNLRPHRRLYIADGKGLRSLKIYGCSKITIR